MTESRSHSDQSSRDPLWWAEEAADLYSLSVEAASGYRLKNETVSERRSRIDGLRERARDHALIGIALALAGGKPHE